MPSPRTQRAIDAVEAAWPHLATDAFVEQLVLVVLRAADGPAPDTSTHLPAWLIRATQALPQHDQGVALGFAAAGYVAGRNAELAGGPDA